MSCVVISNALVTLCRNLSLCSLPDGPEVPPQPGLSKLAAFHVIICDFSPVFPDEPDSMTSYGVCADTPRCFSLQRYAKKHNKVAA